GTKARWRGRRGDEQRGRGGEGEKGRRGDAETRGRGGQAVRRSGGQAVAGYRGGGGMVGVMSLHGFGTGGGLWKRAGGGGAGPGQVCPGGAGFPRGCGTESRHGG